MAQWVKAHEAREGSVFNEIEIMKNLPPSRLKTSSANAELTGLAF